MLPFVFAVFLCILSTCCDLTLADAAADVSAAEESSKSETTMAVQEGHPLESVEQEPSADSSTPAVSKQRSGLFGQSVDVPPSDEAQGTIVPAAATIPSEQVQADSQQPSADSSTPALSMQSSGFFGQPVDVPPRDEAHGGIVPDAATIPSEQVKTENPTEISGGLFAKVRARFSSLSGTDDDLDDVGANAGASRKSLLQSLFGIAGDSIPNEQPPAFFDAIPKSPQYTSRMFPRSRQGQPEKVAEDFPPDAVSFIQVSSGIRLNQHKRGKSKHDEL